MPTPTRPTTGRGEGEGEGEGATSAIDSTHKLSAQLKKLPKKLAAKNIFLIIYYGIY
jgi:hypothetical protein